MIYILVCARVRVRGEWSGNWSQRAAFHMNGGWGGGGGGRRPPPLQTYAGSGAVYMISVSSFLDFDHDCLGTRLDAAWQLYTEQRRRREVRG